jgi:hypothetical protein
VNLFLRGWSGFISVNEFNEALRDKGSGSRREV